jgi:transposase
MKGYSYAIVVSDLDKARVFNVAKDRKEESLSEILEKIPKGQRAEITAVVIDMWEPYMNTVEISLPEVDIIHDKFHISKHLIEAVDKVRKTENREL